MLSKLLLSLLALPVLAYICFLALLYFSQHKMLFPGANFGPLFYKNLHGFSEDIYLGSTKLQGWRFDGKNPRSEFIAIYFGGNGEDVAGKQLIFQQLNVQTTYTYNYRGYGDSDGQPNEQSIYSDALDIYDMVSKKTPNKKIIIIGHSLGSAIAGFVATKRPTEKLILLTPLSSVPEVAQSHFKNAFPQWLVKYKFNLTRYASKITAEVLVILAQNDKTIPSAESMKTYNTIKSSKEIIEIPNSGHNDLFLFPQTINKINGFIH